MANVETLVWSLGVLRVLSGHVIRPLTMERLRTLYPQMPRTTLLNRMDSLVAAGFAVRDDGGWLLHPEASEIFLTMHKNFVGSLRADMKRAEGHNLHI